MQTINSYTAANLGKWTKFISICIFIAIGFLVLIIIGLLGSMTYINSMLPLIEQAAEEKPELASIKPMLGFGVMGIVIILLLFVGLYLFWGIKLNKFSSGMRLYSATGDDAHLATGFNNLSSYLIVQLVFGIISLVFSLFMVATVLFFATNL